MDPVVYCLTHSGRLSYVGWTNHLARRLRQHNGELTRGARRTRMAGPGWTLLYVVRGLASKSAALSLEAKLHWDSRRRAEMKQRSVPVASRRLAQLERVLKTMQDPDQLTVAL